MFIKIVAGLVAFWVVGACGATSTIIWERMLTEVNAQLPETERFSRTWWGPMKRARFYREYRRLGLPRRPLVWQAALGIAMLAAVVAVFSILTSM